ncbi:MAG: DUF4418 family protein [Treponema sp.]|nr:DUF4418 family protein [Treponema sp.]
MKKNIVFAVIIFIFGLLVAIAPFTFARVCEIGEKLMKCHWTARIELFLGVALAFLALLKLISANKMFQLGLAAGIMVIVCGVILVPSVLIGVCGMPMMHCHSVARPTLVVLGILIFFAVVIDMVMIWKKSS